MPAHGRVCQLETLGETWEEEFEQTGADALKARAEDYLAPCPGGVEVVVALTPRAIAGSWSGAPSAGERRAWTGDYEVIYSNPADEQGVGCQLAPTRGAASPTSPGIGVGRRRLC